MSRFKTPHSLPHRQVLPWRLLLTLLLLVGIALLGIFLFANEALLPRSALAAAIRTDLKADYRADLHGRVVYAPVKPDLIVDVLLDAGVQGNLTATVAYQMQAPVVTVTPAPGQTLPVLRVPQATSTATVQFSPTPVLLTATPAATLTAAITETPSATPSATATLVKVIPPTRTVNTIPPTATSGASEPTPEDPQPTDPPLPTDPPPVPTDPPPPTEPPPAPTDDPYPYP